MKKAFLILIFLPFLAQAQTILPNGAKMYNGLFYGILYTNSLSGNRSWKLPDSSGTLALASSFSSFIPWSDTGSTANKIVNFWQLANYYARGDTSTVLASKSFLTNQYQSILSDAANIAYKNSANTFTQNQTITDTNTTSESARTLRLINSDTGQVSLEIKRTGGSYPQSWLFDIEHTTNDLLFYENTIGRKALTLRQSGDVNGKSFDSLLFRGDNNFNVWIGTYGGNGLGNNNTGKDNTAIGFHTLDSNTTGNNLTAIGVGVLQNNTTGHDNEGIGVGALTTNTTGYENSAHGAGSLSSNIDGYDLTATGNDALWGNTHGYQNVADGAGALRLNSIGYGNSALGNYALGANDTGYYNTASGMYSLVKNTFGLGNSGYGATSLHENTLGSGNIGLGEDAGYYNTTQNYRLYINSILTHSNLQDDTSLSIIYGVMASTAAAQRLYLNANVFTKQLVSTSANLTNLTNGYLPYQTSSGLANAGLYWTGSFLGINNSNPQRMLDLTNGSIRLSDNYSLQWGGATVQLSGSNASNYLIANTNNFGVGGNYSALSTEALGVKGANTNNILFALYRSASTTSVGGFDTTMDGGQGISPTSNQMNLWQNTFKRPYFWIAKDTGASYTEASLDSAGTIFLSKLQVGGKNGASGALIDSAKVDTGLAFSVGGVKYHALQTFGGSKVYDCGSIAAGVDSTFSVTCTGAIAGNPVQLGISVAAEPGLVITAECTSNNTVTVRISNHFLVSAVDPASRTYKVLVTNF